LTVPGKVFDTVICLNVIEHLDNDYQAMKNVVDLLDRKGRAIILVPRGQWLFGSLDKVLGHRRRYSREMLKDISENVGLKLIKIIAFNRVSTVPWFLNCRVFKKRSFGIFQIVMLNLFTPIFRRLDRFVPLPSLSYIAILEK